jgi:hypothetical protein
MTVPPDRQGARPRRAATAAAGTRVAQESAGDEVNDRPPGRKVGGDVRSAGVDERAAAIVAGVEARAEAVAGAINDAISDSFDQREVHATDQGGRA